MDIGKLRKMVEAAHNPELAKQPGHVIQIWSDGEITGQKSGELLWQRTLHQHYPPLTKDNDIVTMPVMYDEKKYQSFAFTTIKDALKLRIAMADMVIKDLNYQKFRMEQELEVYEQSPQKEGD